MMSMMKATERRGKRAMASRRTKMCWFFPRGKCAQGDSCTFAHHLSERRVDEESSKMLLCRHWAKGFCRNGGECKFLHSHDVDAEQETPAVAVTAAVPQLYNIGTGQSFLTLPICHRDMEADMWYAASESEGSGLLPCSSPQSPSMIMYEYTPKDNEYAFGNLSWTSSVELHSSPEMPRVDSKSTMDWFSVKEDGESSSTPRSIATRASGSDLPQTPGVDFGEGFCITVANTFLQIQEKDGPAAARTKRASSASP
eukprot:TRINITY_DN29098_c0_g1_i1.p1 TRINITY_DN29098_c0_g1~~TRINITY_DN29098_c0_g1_i1.p1  ORF type:complete len:255 (-),score=52.90 TRINITY_DN29098_c0_g1_i1:731-1495(-)